MKTAKILCPIDFSTLGQNALETATSLARDRGATLVILHVQEPMSAYAGDEFYFGMEGPDRRDLEKMLKRVVPVDPTVRYEHLLITGDPAEAIVRMAETEEVELIVLATHGRTGMLRLVMGSVAEAVVRSAKCPVLTVKAKASFMSKATI